MASDDDETNYWPGFVDALSTMTMMLIFLMLILSLVIVSVSQNVSRAQILAIAKAAKIETKGQPASLENLTAQIISALGRLSENKNPKLPVPEKTPQNVTKFIEPSVKTRVAEKENQAVDEGNRVTSDGIYDSLISSGRSTQSNVAKDIDASDVPSESPPKTSQSAPLEPISGEKTFLEPKSQGSDTRIVSKQKAELAPFGGGIDFQAEKAMVTLVFQQRALKPDQTMIEKFHDYVDTNRDALSKTELEIQAVANSNSGQVTEARRFAYYRAMVVRQMLIEAKLDPKLLRIRIVDTSTDDTHDYVQISSAPKF